MENMPILESDKYKTDLSRSSSGHTFFIVDENCFLSKTIIVRNVDYKK